MPVQGQKAAKGRSNQHRKYPKPVSQQERAWAGWKPENRTKVDNHRADEARRRAMARVVALDRVSQGRQSKERGRRVVWNSL
ncbi:hypothetical protein PPACK8108_LOCUS16429 [Phakopsora pachyrhizi]|uniref:Uncharacterized protein n=1 Tax=Phakopsora pachyrhizi TaxID=170000 RepID=A0AAV0BA38_PHAPC|nr:hypothetical protein PPACK8108_LOCUS16429 [Phakopsora pachyrhizi]